MVEDAVVTEAGSDPTVGYELRQTLELVELMNAADATVTDAVAAVSSQIASAIDAIADRMLAGGRLVYVGAGSSGRIAALDASECEATFSTSAGTVIALVAGGIAAPALVQAAAEDDRPAGEREILALGVSAADAVVGVSASGTTPYVLGALTAARSPYASFRPRSRSSVHSSNTRSRSSPDRRSARGPRVSRPELRRSSCSTRSRRSR